VTISALTVGTAATGNNASVTPGTPSGLAEGDLMLIYAAIRNNGVGTVNTPTGWVALGDTGNTKWLGRYFQTGDVMPLITFTGGVANADTYARALKMRGTAKDVLTEESPASATATGAQNISTPARDVLGADHMLVLGAWKKDDATSLSTPAGFTAQGLTNMTTGDDMLAALFTSLQTTETDIASGSITVTGGAVADSSSMLLSIKAAPTITITQFDLFPPRALVTVTGLDLDDDVTIYRTVDGERAALRGGTLDGATDPSFLVVDGELPFGESIYYAVMINGAEYTTSAFTVDLPGGKPVLSDAITGDSSQFVIAAWNEKEYDLDSSLFKVGGRNVVVSGDVGMFTSAIEIFFEAYSSTPQFLALLNSATEGVLQLRRPSPSYDGVNCYISVTSARETRYSQDGSDGRRMWVLQVSETDPWSDLLVALGFTWGDVETFYTGLTWDDLEDDHATWLALNQADLS